MRSPSNRIQIQDILLSGPRSESPPCLDRWSRIVRTILVDFDVAQNTAVAVAVAVAWIRYHIHSTDPDFSKKQIMRILTTPKRHS